MELHCRSTAVGKDIAVALHIGALCCVVSGQSEGACNTASNFWEMLTFSAPDHT